MRDLNQSERGTSVVVAMLETDKRDPKEAAPVLLAQDVVVAYRG